MTPSDIKRIFRNSLHMYFAPITGAIRGTRREMRRAYRIRDTEMHAAYAIAAGTSTTVTAISSPTPRQK